MANEAAPFRPRRRREQKCRAGRGKLVCPVCPPSRFAHNPIKYAFIFSVTNSTMPPKKKKEEVEDLGAMKAARFGRVKNDLAMGFVGEFGLF